MMAEMPLRVLQVITDPDRRGAQLFAVDLGDALGHVGIEVRTVALAGSQNTPKLDVPALGRRRIAWSTLVALRRELAHVDVAVAHGAQTLPACALATLARHDTVRLPTDQRLAVLGVDVRHGERVSASVCRVPRASSRSGTERRPRCRCTSVCVPIASR